LSDGAIRLAARYPVVWHVIEADGVGPWLRDKGLLPAAMLREGSDNRASFLSVALDGGGTAVLRPQQMPDARLLPTLAGSFAQKPGCWRRHVNQHVFFWAEARRREAFKRSCMRLRPGANEPPVILAFATAALLQRHQGSAFYATINTGSTVRGGARVRRDDNTFRPVAGYRGGAIAELAIRGQVDMCGLCCIVPAAV
jgi:hypothetical protein